MGTDLHPSIIGFFEDRMREHDKVTSCHRVETDDEFIYRISRSGRLPSFHVHLSDAYFYGLTDYEGRPRLIAKGSFILIARPEASFGEELQRLAASEGIGLGKIRHFMGALNLPDPSKYKPRRRDD